MLFAFLAPMLGLALAAADSPRTSNNVAAVCGPDGETGRKVPFIVRPMWTQVPSGYDMAHVYPRDAYVRQAGATVRMSCAVTDWGRLTDCRIIEDDAANLGFDEATLSLAQFFRMKRPAKYPGLEALHCDETSSAPRVMIPVRWTVGR